MFEHMKDPSLATSTDAFQAASKIMSHDYANKYANYWSKKNKTIKSGKANFKDSGRQKTYNAEFKALREIRNHVNKEQDVFYAKKLQTLNWKETVRYCKKIVKSATYKKLCENTVGSSKGKLNVSIEKANFRGATAGQATWYGAIRLQENNCPYTIIHEFAHLCGNMHHDIGFRRDVIKLASMFISKEFGIILKKCFKEAKLKITTGSHIMSPEQWIASVMRMEKIREKMS